jgi:hypothetical protein
VGEGRDNLSSGWWATVGGGELNLSSGWAATVGGGSANTSSEAARPWLTAKATTAVISMPLCREVLPTRPAALAVLPPADSRKFIGGGAVIGDGIGQLEKRLGKLERWLTTLAQDGGGT